MSRREWDHEHVCEREEIAECPASHALRRIASECNYFPGITELNPILELTCHSILPRGLNAAVPESLGDGVTLAHNDLMAFCWV